MIDRDLSVKNVVRYLMKEHHPLFLVQNYLLISGLNI